MEAAVITPAANPVRARWTPAFSSFFSRNTQDDPAAVPANGIISPNSTVFILSLHNPQFHRQLYC
jgi:hypothetical protein